MTNDQRAQRLEELAADKQARAEQWLTGIACDVALADAALLRESAAMWRERGAVQWVECPMDTYIALYKRAFIKVRSFGGTLWALEATTFDGMNSRMRSSIEDTLPAAQAAAVAWCDANADK